MKASNWRPVLYATYFNILTNIAKKYGYALTLHGSLCRDMDIVAIPWVEEKGDWREMLKEMRKTIGYFIAEDEHCPFDTMEFKPHGRLACTIPAGGGAYFDISIILT